MDFLTSGPGVRQGWSQKGCDHHPGYSTTEGFLIVWFWGSVAPSLHVVEQAGAQFFCLSPPLERADAADSLSMGPGGTVSSTVHSFELCFLTYKMAREGRKHICLALDPLSSPGKGC